VTALAVIAAAELVVIVFLANFGLSRLEGWVIRWRRVGTQTVQL